MARNMVRITRNMIKMEKRESMTTTKNTTMVNITTVVGRKTIQKVHNYLLFLLKLNHIFTNVVQFQSTNAI